MPASVRHDHSSDIVSTRITMSDQAPVSNPTPTKMPTSTTGEPSKKAAKPAKPRKVEKRQRGRKG